MNLLKCPRCGEEYSPSYRRCPFCEEGDHPRKIKYNSSKQSGGRRVSDKKQTQSVRGAMAAVLVVVLLLLSWSLFGDKIVAKITPADDGNTPGVQDDINTPDDSNTNTDDPNANNGDTTDPNTGDEPNANDPANGSDTTATNPGTTTTPSTPTVDASALSIKTNVGTTLPKDGNGNFDCTIKSSETIRLSVSGTDAAATWAVADASVLSISADGLITPAKVGTTTVTATVGGAVLTYNDPSVRTRVGIDVSQYQGDVDWNAVARTDVDFVIARVGGRGYTVGAIYDDTKFDEYAGGAARAGLQVGAYFFSQAVSVAEAQEEAYHVLDKLRGHEITGPVVFDWEVIGKREARTYGIETGVLCTAANAFCKIIKDAGYDPMIYITDYAGYVKYDLSEVMDYPLWYARYDVDAPSFYYDFAMWQYSSKGSVDGIKGNVDMDIWFIK